MKVKCKKLNSENIIKEKAELHKTNINNNISSQIQTLVSVSLFYYKLTLYGFGIQGVFPIMKFLPDFGEDPCVWFFYIFFCPLNSFKGIIELANFLQSTKSHKVTNVKKPDKTLLGWNIYIYV